MDITISQEFLDEVKKHIRVLHDEDDSLIRSEIEVAAINIQTQIMLIPEAEIETDVDELDARVKLAIKHQVAKWRTNPDGREESAVNNVLDKYLIYRILGNKVGY